VRYDRRRNLVVAAAVLEVLIGRRSREIVRQAVHFADGDAVAFAGWVRTRRLPKCGWRPP